MTTQMRRIYTTIRRFRPHQAADFHLPALDLTWAEIMEDLDPDWHTGGWDQATQKGDMR